MASVPLNDLARYAAATAAAASARLAQVHASGRYVLGPWVEQFESAFARYLGRAHAVGVGNGSDALELGLRALGIGAGDAVAVTANAAMYSTGAVFAVGATPVFVDVDATLGLIDPELLDVASQVTPLRAVIVTHLYGRVAPIDAVLATCAPRGIAVLEDCAQAHGARDATGRMAGTRGDLAAFSFYPTKNLGAMGDGGALACDDAALAARVRALRQYGWTRKYENTLAHGRNSRLDEVQAALLDLALPDLDARNARRRAIARALSSRIRHPCIAVPTVDDGDVAHLYVVRTPQRDALAAHLASRGIGCDVHYPVPDHRQPVHAGRFAGAALPHTDAHCAQVLSLPCFPELTDVEVDRVVEACNAWPTDVDAGVAGRAA